MFREMVSKLPNGFIHGQTILFQPIDIRKGRILKFLEIRQGLT
jgi:hypothetical protein